MSKSELNACVCLPTYIRFRKEFGRNKNIGETIEIFVYGIKMLEAAKTLNQKYEVSGKYLNSKPVLRL